MHKELTIEEMQHTNGGSSSGNSNSGQHSRTDTLSAGHSGGTEYSDGHGDSISGAFSVGVEVSVTSSHD